MFQRCVNAFYVKSNNIAESPDFFLSSFKDISSPLFLERKEQREISMGERNINQLPLVHALTGD